MQETLEAINFPSICLSMRSETVMLVGIPSAENLPALPEANKTETHD